MATLQAARALGLPEASAKSVLESREEFYMRVYRPRRDVLAAWEERAAARRGEEP